MKIVHICLSGLYMDGWGYQDNMLAKYHQLAGHDVYVIANEYMYDHEGNYVKIDGKEYVQPEVDCNGVRVIRLPLKGNKVLTGPAQRVHYEGLYIQLTKIKPDVIFLHNPQILDVEDIVKYMKEQRVGAGTLEQTEEASSNANTNVSANASANDKDSANTNARVNNGVRLYVDSHSDYSNSGRNFLSKHILHGMLWRSKVQKLVPYTEKFYGVLPARVDFLLDRYHTPKEKTELLVMGMDDELARAAARPEVIKETRDKLGIKEDDFLIVTGGKIDHAKRQTLLLMDAVREINHPKLKLVVFGSVAEDMKEEFLDKCDSTTLLKDGQLPKLKRKSRETGKTVYDQNQVQTSGQINYIGWLNADDTYPYFAAADLVIFPGRHSVMWEQVAGQGIPMIVKYWEGTTHVDLGGNVKFLKEDSVDEIKMSISILILTSIKNQDNSHSLYFSQESNVQEANKGLDGTQCDEKTQGNQARQGLQTACEVTEEYKKMKQIAMEDRKKKFSYKEIARRCIE